jgi:hypothetical protein
MGNSTSPPGSKRPKAHPPSWLSALTRQRTPGLPEPLDHYAAPVAADCAALCSTSRPRFLSPPSHARRGHRYPCRAPQQGQATLLLLMCTPELPPRVPLPHRAAPRQALLPTSHRAKHRQSCHLLPVFASFERAPSSSCRVSKH